MKSTLFPYLGFNGNCRQAMEFYKSVLGGELTMQTFAESGSPISDGEKDLIINADLKNGDLSFMASDARIDQPVNVGDNISMSISGEDAEVLTKYFNQLSEGGKVDMPLEKQFWGDTFGMLTDKFGIHWMINIHTEEPQK